MPNTEQSINETGGVPEIEMEMEVSGMTQAAVDKTLSIADMAADAKATGDAIQAVAEDLSDLAADVSDIEEWTGEDLNVNSDEQSPTIAEAITSIVETINGLSEQILAAVFPVGSVYTSTAGTMPEAIAAIGTWTEIRVPLRWNDMKNGTRTFEVVEAGFTPGELRMWLRTE